MNNAKLIKMSEANAIDDRKLVTMLVPAYNEQEVLPLFYNRVCEVIAPLEEKYSFELLFVNDGSRDDTLAILKALRHKDKRVRYIDLSRNYGKEVAMLAGFDHSRGDCLVTLDADLQEPPETIPLMLEKWEEGYDDVYGRRRQRKQGFFKRFSSKLYHRLLAGISRGSDFQDDAGDFRLMDRKCIEALKSLRESERYTKGLYEVMGFSKIGVDYNVAERAAGHSKWGVGKLFALAVNGIMSHSVLPLRLASYLGLIVSMAAFIYLIVVLIKAMVWGEDVAGYPTIVSLILFIGGFILLALGIIGEYLGRIFMETKNRPVYFVKSVDGKQPQFQKP